MRLRRPWPFQNWKKVDFGYGPMLCVHHSRPLALIGKCKCMGCFEDRYGEQLDAAINDARREAGGEERTQ